MDSSSEVERLNKATGKSSTSTYYLSNRLLGHVDSRRESQGDSAPGPGDVIVDSNTTRGLECELTSNSESTIVLSRVVLCELHFLTNFFE